jgi:WhiB family redox-sensing transcriptional regulator
VTDPAELEPAAPTSLYAEFLFQGAPWMRHAACAGESTALFFPERGESTRPAKSYCRRCPVRQECLDYALDAGEKHGIWGDTSERERRYIRGTRSAP